MRNIFKTNKSFIAFNNRVQTHLGSISTIILNQTHSTNGVIISDCSESVRPDDSPAKLQRSMGGALRQAQDKLRGVEGFEREKNNNLEGDFLITQQKNISLGIRTADCLPIILIDKKEQICANIHAGNKGAIGGIIENCINTLGSLGNFELKAFLGPCAKLCCYEVQNDFLNKVDNKYIYQKNGKLFFDLVKYSVNKLISSGIDLELINLNYNECTICNKDYFSYRRGDLIARQINVVTLL